MVKTLGSDSSYYEKTRMEPKKIDFRELVSYLIFGTLIFNIHQYPTYKRGGINMSTL
jgi:hypothetical protein